MVITLEPDLEDALKDIANRQGIPPEVLALNALRERFIPRVTPVQPQDDWERQVLSVATDCGISLPHSAFSSDGQ